MAIGLTEEHRELAAAARGLAERHGGAPALRAELAGLHLPAEHGGQGYGLLEQAVVLEELGRALTPGPYAPTVLAAAAIAAGGGADLRADVLPGLADGSRAAAVGLGGAPVLGAPGADVFLLPDGGGWAVHDAAAVEVAELESLDEDRPVGAVTARGAGRPVDADVRALAAVLLGAEACGVAGRALDDAVAYAKAREQFGRPIGQFQGVKHRCARMLIAVERARAAVWDAARSLDPYAVGVAAALAADAAVQCAEGNIQVHGGIGYTYEHSAHRIYRRALTLRALIGRASAARADVAALALAGTRREMEVELPADAEGLRADVRARVAELAAMELADQRAAMAAEGWVTPHLPRPWGRDAGPVEQIVIQQELAAAAVRPVPLMIAAWVVPSLVQYGSDAQRERFLPPTLRGEIIWCQLFSEPGAGSDLAGLATRAERAEGGWTITGQKIWTSLARDAQWGICLARTDRDRPKHDGITYFLVDMASPGVEIRPLRECTGDAVFNEVFLDGVFVPDDLVVGPVNEGWRVARNTLANERVGLTGSFQLGGTLPKLVRLAGELGLADDPVVRDEIGALACDEHAFNLLGLRATLKQLARSSRPTDPDRPPGTDPGATANVRKLVAMEHGQRVTEYGFTLLGAEGALTGGWRSDLRRRWTRHLLASRAMSIGGGTTEVNLNVIGERLLGLPRDA
ncbi:acyl-CoA dehydrogenase [Actinomadura parmotrematis]|uniref:Acyl-CoA dehydrogenase n=1 Tax=Actinomadura parmotrematis TaxID=2864039 RepID=A0ABS7G4B8_9ACTN|nr:acyl-CoA dehydrogenase [Actinomadura parmotrematis]MBW8487563.1 acyl-CoA dehydrogenase [Actinomadura parmotrematis]